jgi:hypothetical protein
VDIIKWPSDLTPLLFNFNHGLLQWTSMLAPEHIIVSEKATEKQSESPRPLLPKWGEEERNKGDEQMTTVEERQRLWPLSLEPSDRVHCEHCQQKQLDNPNKI